MIDKRTRFYRTFGGYKFNDYFGGVSFGLLTGLLAGIILFNSTHALPQTPQVSFVPQVVQVDAQEPQPTPTISKRKYTYQNYSKAKHYNEVINYLKEIYINWEDGAELVARESSFRPWIVNEIGACGLAQSLPCSKMKCPLNGEGIKCQLDWQKKYIAGRYETISKALDHSYKLNWY